LTRSVGPFYSVPSFLRSSNCSSPLPLSLLSLDPIAFSNARYSNSMHGLPNIPPPHKPVTSRPGRYMSV
jgi:hypothetical protein